MLRIKFFALLGSLSFIFAACTPPLPPEVLASYAEAEIYCGENQVSVKVNENLFFPISEALYLYGSECGEDLILIDSDIENPDLIITDFSSKDVLPCENPEVSLPVFSQAYSLAYNLGESEGVLLDADTVLAIYSGEITNWNSPEIINLNPDLQLPDTQILVQHLSESPLGVEDFFAWMERMSGLMSYSITESATLQGSFSDVVQGIIFEEGSIGLVPAPLAFENVLSVAEIINNDGNVVYNDSTSYGAGATQVSWSESESKIEVTHDPNKEIPLDPGSEVVVDPYQGMGWSYVLVCGEGNLNLSTSAVARFLFRQDAQGTLDIYGITPLYEPLRLEAAEIAGRLLPQPDIPVD